jgi:hypothetical protein
MLSMGEEPLLSSKPLASRYAPSHLLQDRAMSPASRLQGGLDFNRFATEVALAGERAKADRRGDA